MISFLTGLPGSGKTLRAIWYGLKTKSSGREVYVDGVSDLDFVKTDFRPFARDFSEWATLPPKSLLIVDEAQRFLRRDVIGNSIPDWLEELTRNRHKAIDILFITQDARFLHPMARRLCNFHEHLTRRFGMNMATVLRWEELCEDVSRSTWRKKATVQLWRYPKEVFGLYKSAIEHTVERKVPARIFATIFGVFCALGLFFYAWHVLTGQRATPASFKPKSEVSHLTAHFSEDRDSVKLESSHDYAAQLMPRIVAMPWSAPIFDRRKVVSEPDILCVSSEIKGCQCYTEQVTKISVPMLQCYEIAKNGVYNPYRQPLRAAPAVRGSGSSDRSSEPHGAGSDEPQPVPDGPTARALSARRASAIEAASREGILGGVGLR